MRIMESILKSLNLKKSSETPKEEYQLLFTKRRGGRGYRVRNNNTISINHKSVVVRKGVADYLRVDENGSCSIAVIDNKLCLLASREKDNDLVSLYTATSKKGEKSVNLYGNIPKVNLDIMKNFQGEYTVENLRKIENYVVVDLIKK